MLNEGNFRDIAAEVLNENRRQEILWGEQNHPNGTGERSDEIKANNAKQWCEAARRKGMLTWKYILYEEVMEAFAESSPSELRKELVQVAAVALSWIDNIDRESEVNGHKCHPPKYVLPDADGRMRYDSYLCGSKWTCYQCRQIWRVTDRRELGENAIEMTWSLYRPIIDVALPD